MNSITRPNPGFDTLLVANRGEIACRIIRTARRLGLRTVAVCTTVDVDAPHVALADEAQFLDGDSPLRSHLSIESLLLACRRSAAGAVHPGYGFLSESPAFARACTAAGIVFVGPAAETIELLGNKARAKELAQRIGVPTLPGYAGADQSIAALHREASRIGTPLMIKAAAGGGGRGMRRVDDLARFPSLVESARTEAFAAFGDGTLLLEKLADGARHVEIQIVADAFGRCVHLGDRDCSTQRRHQKIIEEAPAPGLSVQQREAIADAAVRLADAAGYRGAGTVEFLLMPDGGFWFIEVNARLQVEHRVTEEITGIDLVEAQLRIARGEALPWSQSGIRFDGHAIEARLCAEDASDGFAPQSGDIVSWRIPSAPYLRVDHALGENASVSPHFDSMIAKVVAHGRDRDEARRRLIAALAELSLLGPRTNRALLGACLRDVAFVDARLHTGWLGQVARHVDAPAVHDDWKAAASAFLVHSQARAHAALANWSSTGARSVVVSPLADDGSGWLARIAATAGGYRVRIGSSEHEVRFGDDDAVWVDGRRRRMHAYCAFGASGAVHAWLDLDGVTACIVDGGALAAQPKQAQGSADVRAAMHGRVASIVVRAGDAVQAGQTLLLLEAMKMEHRIAAPVAGRIAELPVKAGAQVTPSTLLARIEAASAPHAVSQSRDRGEANGFAAGSS